MSYGSSKTLVLDVRLCLGFVVKTSELQLVFSEASDSSENFALPHKSMSSRSSPALFTSLNGTLQHLTQNIPWLQSFVGVRTDFLTAELLSV
jgi:hypothetical protein